MRILGKGTKVMLTGTITDMRRTGINKDEIIYYIDIDGDYHLPVYVSEEAVKVAPWMGDDGK